MLVSIRKWHIKTPKTALWPKMVINHFFLKYLNRVFYQKILTLSQNALYHRVPGIKTLPMSINKHCDKKKNGDKYYGKESFLLEVENDANCLRKEKKKKSRT